MTKRWPLAWLWLACSAALASSGCMFANFDLGAFGGPEPLEEKLMFGEKGDKIVMLEIDGVIQEGPQRNALGGLRPSMIARTREALDLAAEDDDVVALIVRIQSPGGTVSASETLHHEILSWKEETELPVVAYLQGLATSGGYYVAMAADEVIAHPATVTGSIGVLLRGVNVSGLMERFGVEDQSLKSGGFKDAGSPLRPMRSEEREQLQTVIDDFYGRFIEVVAKGRPELEPDRVRALADGRIYSSNQALEAGLIDSIAHLDEAVDVAEARAGIEEGRVIVYKERNEYVDNIHSRAPVGPLNVDVDVISLDSLDLTPGFYYIWPWILQ